MSSEVDQPAPGRSKLVAVQQADMIMALPDGEFRAHEIADPLVEKLRAYQSSGVVEVVNVEQEDKGTKVRNVYRVNDGIRQAAREQKENRDAMCPCDHAGVRNCGDHYECCFVLCDRQFERSDLEVQQ